MYGLLAFAECMNISTVRQGLLLGLLLDHVKASSLLGFTADAFLPGQVSSLAIGKQCRIIISYRAQNQSQCGEPVFCDSLYYQEGDR